MTYRRRPVSNSAGPALACAGRYALNASTSPTFCGYARHHSSKFDRTAASSCARVECGALDPGLWSVKWVWLGVSCNATLALSAMPGGVVSASLGGVARDATCKKV